MRSGQAGTHLDVREDGAVVVHLRVGHLGIGQDLPHCHCIRPLCVQHQHTELIQTTMQQHHNTAYTMYVHNAHVLYCILHAHCAEYIRLRYTCMLRRECRGFESHPRQLTALGVLSCFVLLFV